MTLLLESGARPYHTRKGIVASMVVHGALIAAAVLGTAKVILPPREKVEQHTVLYVATPPPPEVHVAPDPIPPPPKEKARNAPPPAVKRVQAPRPVAPTPQPKAPVLVAPTKIAVVLPAIDLKAIPTVSDIVVSAPPATIAAAPVSRDASSSYAGEGGASSRRGLGSGGSGKAFEENEVDRAVKVRSGAEPRYPDALRSVGVEGTVSVRFIVGADGKVEPGSIQAIDSPNRLFTESVRTALLNTRYRPAEAGGRPVRQLVEQGFSFKLTKR